MTERDAIAEEQAFLDSALERRDQVIHELREQLAETPAGATHDPVRQARIRDLHGRLADLHHAETNLVFGRLEGLDGDVRHVGRVGIPGVGRDAEPLVLDWRAPAARAFYTATALDPAGQASRRHIRTEGRRVVHVDDEPLDASAVGTDLVGEAALLRALSGPRTGRMGTAVATLQREQDAIVRAEPDGPLVVQGGPGTGKTVVALHRVAYLLFTYPQLARRGVLLVGPSTRFLDYIAQVLPALGETQVVSATCDRLVPGEVATRTEARELAEIKGRALWQQALTDYVASLVPRAGDLAFVVDGEEYVVPQHAVARALRSARSSARPYHQARQVCAEQLRDLLTAAVAERSEELLAAAETGYEDVLAVVDAALARSDDRGVHRGVRGAEIDGLLSEADVDSLRERIGADPGVARVLDRWWATRDPGATLGDLLSDPAALRRFAPQLSEREVEAVAAEPAGWAPSDLALLDAVADILGETTSPERQGTFLAEEAAARRDWTYGHIAVDEAQELSAMQWHMLLRRCPARSFTIVGDIDQTEAPHRHTTWDEALRPALGDAVTKAELTICYRTPREVMALTWEVLRHAGSRGAPPTAVRTTGIEPWSRACAEEALVPAVREAVAAMRGRHQDGTLAVIAPPGRIARLRTALTTDEVSVLSPATAKGLEFDATLVVDAEGIASRPRGWNALYVAMTRCTQELGQVRPA